MKHDNNDNNIVWYSQKTSSLEFIDKYSKFMSNNN